MVVIVSGKLPELNINDRTSIINYIISVSILLGFAVTALFTVGKVVKKEMKKNEKELKAVYDIIKKIIDGELTDSNSIRKAWYEAKVPL